MPKEAIVRASPAMVRTGVTWRPKACPRSSGIEASRADMLRRLDRPAEAAAAYRTALTLTTNPAERRHLERRIAECR